MGGTRRLFSVRSWTRAHMRVVVGDAGVVGFGAARGGDAEAAEAGVHAGEVVLDRRVVGEIGVDDLPELGVGRIQGRSDDRETSATVSSRRASRPIIPEVPKAMTRTISPGREG